VEIEAHDIGAQRFAVAFVVYRRDGVTCMQLVSETFKHDFARVSQRVCVTAEVAPLRLGPGAYLVSVGLYESREALDDGDPHALLEAYDRHYEFEVGSSATWMTSVLIEQGRWSMEENSPDAFTRQTERGTPEGSPRDMATARPATPSFRTLRDEIEQVVFKEGGYPDRWECHPQCPCCQGSDIARRYFAKYGIWHSWCRGCDFVFVDPCPPSELLDRLYNGAYYNAVRELIEAARARQDPGNAALFSVPIALFDEALRHICRVQKPGSWLDFGGGIGSFAWRVRSQLTDCDVRLYELNALSQRLSAEIYGLPPAETSRRFDCVSMLSVLEHCPEPARMVEEAAAWARPGGQLLIYVPRFSPLCRTVAKGSAVNVIPPFHASLFDRRSMAALLTRCPSIASYEMTIEGPPAFSPLYLMDYGDHWDIEVPTAEGQEIRSIQTREYDSTTSQLLNMLATVAPRLDDFLAEVDGGLFLRVIARVHPVP
jgi:SAM-dependent methyltransferase